MPDQFIVEDRQTDEYPSEEKGIMLFFGETPIKLFTENYWAIENLAKRLNTTYKLFSPKQKSTTSGNVEPTTES